MYTTGFFVSAVFCCQRGADELFVGPVFFREASTTPRRARHFVVRAVYVLALLVLICTAWFVLAGTQIVRNIDGHGLRMTR